MNMFRKKTGDYLDKCSILLHGYKLFAVLLLAFGMAACDDDNTVPEPDPEPTSTFKLLYLQAAHRRGKHRADGFGSP